MSAPVATPGDLALLLGTEVDETRAVFLIQQAQILCESIVTVSPAIQPVVTRVAARAYNNPNSATQLGIGSANATLATTGAGGVGGLFLSRADKADLRRLSGRSGGAFSADPLPGGVSAVQSVALLGSPTGGTFTLAFGGAATSPLAFNADAPTVQTALAALATVGAGNVTVTGSAGAWTVSFGGALGLSPLPNLVPTASLTGGTTPSVQVVTTTLGVLAPGQGLGAWNYDYGARRSTFPGGWPC